MAAERASSYFAYRSSRYFAAGLLAAMNWSATTKAWETPSCNAMRISSHQILRNS